MGKYTLLRKIATGGMAEVFLARAEGAAGFQKTLVIKRILPNLAEDTQFVEMFLNEARVASQLNHPNVVSIHELGEVDGQFYIAMEFIDGPNLRALSRRALEAGKQLDAAEVAKIIALACEGLQYAHDAVGIDGQPLNLIHRDISPDNVLVSRQGAVKVVDFGIAKAANQPHLTKSGMLKGKLAYMPPEQIRGQTLDRRADVFALGVCLYELLAGAKPFDSTSEVAVMQAILHQPPAPILEVRADLDPELASILDRALAKDREQRYPSCAAFQADLDAFLVKRHISIGARDLAKVVEGLMGPAAPLPTPVSGIRSGPIPSGPGQKGGTPPDFNRGISRSRPGAVEEPADDDDRTRSDVASSELPAPQKKFPLVPVLGAGVLVLVGGVAFLAHHTHQAVQAEVIRVPPPKPRPAPVAVAQPAPQPVQQQPQPKPPEPAPVVKPPEVVQPKPEPKVEAKVEPKPAPEEKPERREKVDKRRRAQPKKVAEAKPTPPAPVQPAAVQTGKISVRVLPFAEDVVLDGKHLGQTPLDTEPVVPAGHHKVVLVRGGVSKDFDVNVPAGGQAVVKFVFDN